MTTQQPNFLIIPREDVEAINLTPAFDFLGIRIFRWTDGINGLKLP